MIRIMENFDPHFPPHLADDGELIEMIKLMKFIPIKCDNMELTKFEELAPEEASSIKLDLIEKFVDWYSNTGQDTVTFAPEFFVVVREILAGNRPTKLIYLTDFDGEDKV